MLKDKNIKVIINVTTEISEYYPDEFIYLRYKLYDNNKHSIKHYLEQSYEDIIPDNFQCFNLCRFCENAVKPPAIL